MGRYSPVANKYSVGQPTRRELRRWVGLKLIFVALTFGTLVIALYALSGIVSASAQLLQSDFESRLEHLVLLLALADVDGTQFAAELTSVGRFAAITIGLDSMADLFSGLIVRDLLFILMLAGLPVAVASVGIVDYRFGASRRRVALYVLYVSVGGSAYVLAAFVEVTFETIVAPLLLTLFLGFAVSLAD